MAKRLEENSGFNSGEKGILSTNRSLHFEAESILFKVNQGIARQQRIDLAIISGENIGR